MIQLTKYNPRQLSREKLIGLKEVWAGQFNSVILSTCLRLEIYQGEGPVECATAEHLFRLTSGLESIFTGDPSVQGQVKKAYLKTLEHKSLDKYMHRLFQTALRTGKLVRSRTGISHGAINYPQATINLIKKHAGAIEPLTGIVIGVNQLTDNILTILKKEGIKKLSLVNRSKHHGDELGSKHKVPFVPLSEMDELLAKSHFAISCTSSNQAIITPAQLIPSPSLLIDLAVPGNIEKNVETVKGIKLLTLEDVENSIDLNLSFRRNEILKAEEIVLEQVQELMNWQKTGTKRPIGGNPKTI